MKKNIKKLISILVCVVLCVSLSSSAFAELAIVTRAKALIAATMLASNLVLEPVDAAIANAVANAVDPFQQVEIINNSSWQDYLDQSVIEVRPNSVTIDGVQYSDILLGSEAASSLRASGLDFVTAYNILNNQNESVCYASGVGYVDGVPIYNINGSLRSAYYKGDVNSTFMMGDIIVSGELYNSSNYYSRFTASNGNNVRVNAGGTIFNPYNFWITTNSQFSSIYMHRSRTYTGGVSGNLVNPPVDITPFSFDYTSGVIDAPLADDDWLSIRVPTQYSDPDSGITYNIQNIVNNYPSLPQGHTINVNPVLNPDFQNDINLGNDLTDLVNTILNLLHLLKNTGGFAVNFVKHTQPDPQPDPAPVPDPDEIPTVAPDPDSPLQYDTIGDTDFSFLENLLRWIQSTINSFRVAVQNQLHNLLQMFSSFQLAFENAIQSILDFFQDILDGIHNIYDMIADFLQDILDAIQNIDQILQDLFDNILDAIEQGPVKLWRSALNVLKTVFAPILATLKTFVGLWHYVVEWVGVILNPFLWFFNLMSGTSYNMVLPIYAGLAGFIVIAIYKRFGR